MARLATGGGPASVVEGKMSFDMLHNGWAGKGEMDHRFKATVKLENYIYCTTSEHIT